jgi:hypothetical protein
VKIGAENKKQVIIMAILLAVAAAVVIYDFSGSGTSSAAPPVRSSSGGVTTSGRPGTQPAAQNDLDPRLRLDVLEASRKVKYEAGGRNIFRMEEPKIEPPKYPVRQPTPTPGPPTPTPTPPPPPIPLKFYGFANKPGEAKKIFLAEGDPQNSVVFIAKQGDIVDRRYRVVQISANSVQIEDVLYNNKQTIPLTAR